MSVTDGPARRSVGQEVRMLRPCLTAVLLAALVVPAPVAAPPLPLPPPVFDIPYATEHPSQLFDWYPPANPTGHDPVLLYIHGGKPPLGDKTLVTYLHSAELEMWRLNGIGVMSMDFHPWIDFGFPVQKYDGQKMMQYLRAHAADFGIDPQRVGIWGHSSGSMIGGWLAWGENAQLATGTLEQQQSSRPDVYMNFIGITDFTLMVPQFPGWFFATPKLLHVPLATLQQASLTWLLANERREFTPPVFSVYGQTANPPPLIDFHDGYFGIALHAAMRVNEPSADALSAYEIHDELLEDLDLQSLEWLMKRFGMPGPGMAVHAK
jgi:hypothetical protein